MDTNLFKIHIFTVNPLQCLWGGEKVNINEGKDNQKEREKERERERSNLFTLLISLHSKPIFPCCILDIKIYGVHFIAALSIATVMEALSFRKPTPTRVPFSLTV
jgi:hypothetical protein